MSDIVSEHQLTSLPTLMLSHKVCIHNNLLHQCLKLGAKSYYTILSLANFQLEPTGILVSVSTTARTDS